MKIYIIEGNNNFYDSGFTWIVKAFKTQDKANDFINVLNSLIDELNDIKIRRKTGRKKKDIRAHLKLLDDNVSDYEYTSYDIFEVELEE